MVACARREIVRQGEVGVYHCWARCVRRAFLCGKDPLTGRDFQHRRAWLRDLEEQLAGLFGIEVAFHAEMSNHLHLVLRTRPDVVAGWSDAEVARRWLKIAKLKRGSLDEHWEPGPAQVRRQLADARRVQVLRRRLASVSWFMGAVCEHLARRANQEDGCRGRFWETRFASRELACEGALLVCGMYVDLNPIRAGEAFTPETSLYTSAYDRIVGRQPRTDNQQSDPRRNDAGRRDRWLCELTLQAGLTAAVTPERGVPTAWRASDKGLLPLSLDDYLQLLDWTGRQFRVDKQGSIPTSLAPILERLQVRAENWLETIAEFDSGFGRIVGRVEHLSQAAARLGRRWLQGTRQAAQAFT